MCSSSEGAFAAILGDGSVVTWGLAACGGDCSAVQGQLKNVQQIQAGDVALLPFLPTGRSSLGVLQTMVVTAALCSISRRMCSRSKPVAMLLLQFLPMELWNCCNLGIC